MNYKLVFWGLLLLLFTSQAYASLTDDLVSYYKLDETSGTTLADETGTYPVTHSGVTLNQTGKIGKAITINATINNFNIGYLGTNSSINAWHKLISGTSGPGAMFEIPVTSNRFHQLLIDYNGTNYIFTSYSQCGGTKYSFNSSSISSSNYNMITVTWDSANYYVYINGVYEGSFTKGSTGSCNALNWRMGRYNKQYFDEIGIWNRTLTSDEVTTLYNSGAGLTYPFDVNAIYADFTYVVDELDVDLNDTSTISGDAVIDSWEWLIDGVSVSTDQNYGFTGTEATDYNVCLIVQDTVLSLEDSYCQTVSIGDITPPVTTFSSFQVPNTTDQNITLTCTDDNTGCQYINFRINNGDWNYYTIGDNPLTIIYSSAGQHSISYFSTDSADNNETIKTSNFTTYGTGHFTFYDENTYTAINSVDYNISPSINGISSGTTTANKLDLNFQGITSGTYQFTFSKTGYGTRYYYTTLNEFSSFDYNQLMLQDTNGNDEVELTIYTYTGTAILPNTPITITKNNYLVGRYLTDSTGTINPFLKDQDVNYLFNVEGYYSLGQVAILFNRPIWDTNLGYIAGTWQITLTSPQSTTRYLITTNSQTIAILPNTVEDYSAKVCMYGVSNCNTNYISRTFLLSYKGNLGETSIQPYLNLVSASTLRTLKVLNYGTAQPHPDAKLEIRTKTEAGVDYLVESVITDSTGLATTYLNDAQTYYITANDVTVYKVTPNDTVTTYYIYFNYITLPSSTITPIDVNTSNDTNTLIGQVYGFRNALFTSCTLQNDCFPAVFFSILITFLILFSVTNMTQSNNPVGIKGLALVAFCSLTIFFGIGWLPVYIFAFLGAISMLLVVVVQ